MKKVSMLTIAAILTFATIESNAAKADKKVVNNERSFSESRASMEITRMGSPKGEVVLKIELGQHEDASGILSITDLNGLELYKQSIKTAKEELMVKLYASEVNEFNISFSNRNASVSRHFYLDVKKNDIRLYELK